MIKKSPLHRRRQEKDKFAAIILLTIIILFSLPLMADLDISGYFENRFFLVENPAISWKNLNDKFSLGDYNRLRLKYKASPSDKVTVNLALDFFSFHGIMTSPLGTYNSAAEPGADNTVKIDLDRAYVNLYFKNFDLTLGKQRVALGVSYLWAPLDVFNRVNFLEPKEEKPGANAVKLYVPLGPSSSLTGVFSPESDFSTSKSGFRAQTQALGIDMALTLIRTGAEETSIYGVDLRGENLIGWWLEGGYFVSPQRQDMKIVFGFDYTFGIKRGLYWLNEFYYDQSGEKDPANYDYQKVLSGLRFTMGQKYYFSMLRYAFSDFFSGSLGYIANWGDGSYILNPGFQYDVSQNVLVSVGFYIPLGRENGEFRENKPNLFFIWLKINF
ncbi:MAG: hypothetical protein KAW12_24975 [Candidatus Aminicenantes bacterium]|nr:hypothetical protein [Candidatus Aminicenantes bacterium]